jgi:hypothetical protein
MSNTLFYKTPEFKKLHKKWISKLKNSNFIDLEHVNGFTQDSDSQPFLNLSDYNIRKSLSRHRFEFYRAAQHFNAHNRKWTSRAERIMFGMFCDGVSYRNMIKMLKRRRIKRSIFWISYHVNSCIDRMLIFNREHPMGLRAIDAEREVDLRDDIKEIMESNVSVV